jgi:hypothetical protein
VAIDKPGGNLSLRIKSRAQQSKWIYSVWYIYLQNNGLLLQKRLHSLKEQMNKKKENNLSVTS